MRKWTYLVAALLMGGVTTSLTSCIDNDEPAGINELRGAKAAFIKAKADYEAALTAIKLVEVDIKKQELAREEIQTQIKQLELEVAQAQTEYDVARINAQKDLLVEQYKTQLIQQQAWTAEAEATLIKALNALDIVKLNDRNDKFAAQIENIRVALVDANNGALAKLRKAQEEVFNAEKDLLAYDSQSKYFKSEKQLSISIKQHDLEVYEGLKADYEELNKTAGDMEALAAKKGEIQAKITALSKKEADEFQKLQEMRRSESFVAFSEAIQEYKLTQDKDTTFTLKKVDAALQNDFYNALTRVSFHTGGLDLDDFFKQNPTTGEYEMTADYQSPETVSGTKVQVKNVGTSVVMPITNEVKTTYQNGYTSEYNALFNARKASTDIFDAVTGKVNASIAAQVQAEKDRLQINKTNIENEFNAAIKAWVDSYIAYEKALKAYGFYSNGTNKAYTEMEKTILAYAELDATKQTEAEAIKLRDAIVAYATLRNAVDDGTTNAVDWSNFKTNYAKTATADPLKTPATLTSFNAMINGLTTTTIQNLIGGKDLVTTYTTDQSYEGDGTLQKFYNAYVTLFVDQNVNGHRIGKEDVIVPILVNGAAPEKITDAIPEDIDGTTGSGAYSAYINATDFAGNNPFITNIDKWTALYDNLNKQVELIAARNKELTDAIDTVVAQWDDELVKVWEAELQVYLILGNQNIGGKVVISNDNPYKDYLNTTSNPEDGGIGYAARTEKKALEDELAFVQNALDNDGKFTVVTFDPNTNSYNTKITSDLTGLIEGMAQTIIDQQEEIEKIQLEIDQFDQLGFFNGSYRDILVKKVEDAKANVEICKTIVDNYNKTLQNMLKAYEVSGGADDGSETPAE